MSLTDEARKVDDLARRSLLRLRALRSSGARKHHASRLLGVLNNADVRIRRELSAYEGRTVPVAAIPPFVTLTPSMINEISIMATPYADKLADVVNTGTVTIDDSDTMLWISALALTVLAGAALFFSLPLLAIVAGLGAAITAILASMDDLVSGGADVPLSNTLSSLTVLLVAAAAAYWLLFRRNR